MQSVACAYGPKLAPARSQPRVWLLTDNCAGDTNQLLALATALGFPFETKPINYNLLRLIPPLRKDLAIVAVQSREHLSPPWPDLVIGGGYRSVPVARYIRRQSGGQAKLVHIGNPRARLQDFDLQITTPQYARKPESNLLELPFPIGNPARTAKQTPEEQRWLRAFPRPRRMVAVGGLARHWRLDETALSQAVCAIRDKNPAGSLIVAVSRRTPKHVRRQLNKVAAGPSQAVVDCFPAFGTLLAQCDEIYVTADSVSMISEAILSGKPVGLIPIKRSPRGVLMHWLWERPFGQSTFPNFENFWNMLHERRLAGTVELPVASQVCDTVERAADAVRSLLAPGDAVDGGRT